MQKMHKWLLPHRCFIPDVSTYDHDMNGWHISLYQQRDRSTLPAELDTQQGKRLAVWQSGIGGLGWIYTLINKNKAIELAADGYPSRYTAQAKDILPELDGEPPEANAVWSCGPNDQLSKELNAGGLKQIDLDGEAAYADAVWEEES